MYIEKPMYNKETITTDELFKLSASYRKASNAKDPKKIYNPKTKRMILIDGLAYNKLLHDTYIHWKEERLLIPPFHELPILRRWISFESKHIQNIISEKSLLTKVNGKINLLQILLKANLPDYTICQMLKICWNHKETQKWRNDILAKFIHHLNLTPSKYTPNALYDAFFNSNVLGPEHILALMRTLY